MDILLSLLTSVWIVRIIFNILSYAHLWWVKEYRWDRMIIHMKMPQGRRFLWPPLRRPPITPKSTLLVLAGFIVSGWMVWVFPWPVLLRLLVADALSFPMTWILVLIFNAPVKLYHRLLIRLAVRKLRSHQAMTVIGITGSYGKTSTKNHLATLLSSKFKTIKTEASKNSPIAIAETVLKYLMPDTQVFVVEMGAYKRGEIRVMADMVQPTIGIVTAINAQHQYLFGTIETTMKAKYELITGLVGKQIAIFNADNAYVRQMMSWAARDGKTIWAYSKEKHAPKIADKMFFAENIDADLRGVSFDAIVGKARGHITARVLGEHQVSNILAAIAASVAAGMELSEAAAAASTIRPPPKTMEPVAGTNGSTFIDDTFNNNPDAALAALAFLKKTTGRKILVFQPMIELGAFAAESHRRVAQEAGKICDDILLTNDNFAKHFQEGARLVNAGNKVRVLTAAAAAAHIRRTVARGDTVLFKGKEAERVFHLCFKR